MSQFYHQNVTEKSFQTLVELNKNYNFILIGGWAVFLYSNSLKSKDIDIILDYSELGKLREKFSINKNDRLKKYEIKTRDFDIDIYLSYYSEIGLPIEEIMKLTQKRKGFLVPELEILFILKLYAWQKRKGSIKGRKDELDILSLISLTEFDYVNYLKIINKFNFKKEHQAFICFLKKTRSISELKLNEQQVSKLKKNIFSKIDE